MARCLVAGLEVLLGNMRNKGEAKNGEEAKEFHGRHQWFASSYRISPATRVLNKVGNLCWVVVLPIVPACRAGKCRLR